MGESFGAGRHYAAHSDVANLQHHWGSAYLITYRLGQFRAVRRDDGSAVRADSAGQLLELIREDYALRPVPRPRDSEED